ncbi:MAG: fimbrillin family protein [Bacteroides sp.]|nr:fimbrillin family protein [Bacteroides sp.]
MKKNYLLWALAVVSLAGCSQNEITEVSPDAHPAVGFSVYTGTQARGAETDNNAIQGSGKGFGILAYYTGQSDMGTSSTPNFMWNQQVTYDTSNKVWKYTPLKYWPNTTGDKVSFYAYAPYLSDQTGTPKIALSANNATGYPTIKFTIADEAKDMVDLVTDSVINQTKTTSNVSFTLKHKLTKAIFKARLGSDYFKSDGDADKTKIYITGVSLVADGSTNTGLFLYATYKFAKEDGQWDTSTTSSSGGAGSAPAALMTSNYSLASILSTSSSSSVTVGSTTKDAIEISSSTTAVDLFKTSPTAEALYLIPVNYLTGIDSNKKVQVKLEYCIKTEDSNLNGGSSVVPCEVTVDLPDGTLKQSTAYTYTFVLGLTEVKVEASIVQDGWVNGTGGDVAVPKTN